MRLMDVAKSIPCESFCAIVQPRAALLMTMSSGGIKSTWPRLQSTTSVYHKLKLHSTNSILTFDPSFVRARPLSQRFDQALAQRTRHRALCLQTSSLLWLPPVTDVSSRRHCQKRHVLSVLRVSTRFRPEHGAMRFHTSVPHTLHAKAKKMIWKLSNTYTPSTHTYGANVPCIRAEPCLASRLLH